MRVTPILATALSVAAFSGLVPVLAQENVAVAVAQGNDAAKSVQEGADLTPVEQWQADKTRVFDAAEVDLADFRWIARPVVVFAEAPAVPAFQDQMDLLERDADQLARRDVVVITDTDPAAMTSVRRELRPRGFQLTLIGKDGEVKLRKPSPWHVRELSRSIDKMPMRQREMREGG